MSPCLIAKRLHHAVGGGALNIVGVGVGFVCGCGCVNTAKPELCESRESQPPCLTRALCDAAPAWRRSSSTRSFWHQRRHAQSCTFACHRTANPLCVTVVVCSADRNLESASFIHMRHGKLILVAITRDNTNVFLILKYLHNLVEVSTAPADCSALSVNRESGEACFVHKGALAFCAFTLGLSDLSRCSSHISAPSTRSRFGTTSF